MPKPKNVALYVRVSTDGQTCENQLRELRAAIARHGWTIAAEYVDRGVSGAAGVLSDEDDVDLGDPLWRR